MNPLIAGPLIGGIAGLFGAGKDRRHQQAMFQQQVAVEDRRARIARRQQLQDMRRERRLSKRDQASYFADTRRFAEEAGFNPLSVLGMLPGAAAPSGGGIGPTPATVPAMGSNFSEAAMMAGNAFGNALDLAGEWSKAQMVNQQLTEKIKALTIRPKVAGIYAQREAMPSLSKKFGVKNAQGFRSSSQALAPVGRSRDDDLFGPRPVLGNDPRREVVATEVLSDPGYSIIDNPAFGEPFSVPTFNGEIVELGQWPTIALGWTAHKMDKGLQAPRKLLKRYFPPAAARSTRRFDPNFASAYHWSY